MKDKLLKKTLQKINCIELYSCAGAAPIKPEELSKGVDINKLKLPFVIKDKILMSPGTWNGMNYSMNSIQKGFEQTNWDSKEIRSLFLDHQDDNKTPNMAVSNWVGDVQNVRLDGNDIRGDLYIVDENTARKLAYGARFGISPRLMAEEDNGQIYDFQFENFSVVFTPAVKTAYINNSQKPVEEKAGKFFHLGEQEEKFINEIVTRVVREELKVVTGMEAERKKRGLSPAQFYAAPRDPPSSSALPIFDAAHVRNAMARFNQTQFRSAEEKSRAKGKINSAAKKFNIKVGEFEEQKPSKDVEEKMDEKLSEQELADVQEIIKKAKEIQKEGESWKDAMKRAADMLTKKEPAKESLEEAKPEAPKEEAPAEPAKEAPVEEPKEEPKEEVKEEKAEEKKEEMKEEKKEEPSELQKIKAELSELKAKLNEPARKSTKSVELAKGIEELSERDQTIALASYLKRVKTHGGGL